MTTLSTSDARAVNPDLVESLPARIASALSVAPHLVSIDGQRLRYMGLFLQSWGTVGETRFFAKTLLVDRYPAPPRFATPAEELEISGAPVRSVEKQIGIETRKCVRMRGIMGSREIPALLGYSVPFRTLVYQHVEGTQANELIARRFEGWLPGVRQREADGIEAIAKAGAWLRHLHHLTMSSCEWVQPAAVIENLVRLIARQGLENSACGDQALRILKASLENRALKRPVEVPVALNHGDFTLPNLLWSHDRRQLWVIDFEFSSYRGIIHDLGTMIFDLRRHLLHPRSLPASIAACEWAFWSGYGPVAPELLGLINGLATSRLFYHTLPKLRSWGKERGTWAGIKSLTYRRIFEPMLIRQFLKWEHPRPGNAFQASPANAG